MKQGICTAAVICFLLPLVGLADDSNPTIKDIMKKAHDNKNGLRTKIRLEADKSSPDWAELQNMSKEFVELASALEKNKPPRGDGTSWKKQTKAYVDQVQALNDAVAKKNAPMVKAANQKLTASCSGCHKAHRE